MHSSLEVFDIDTDKGISRRGSIDHAPLVGESSECYGAYGHCSLYNARVCRGLFRGDFV